MDWKGYRRSDNVDDRRGGGGSPLGRGGLRFPMGGGMRRAGGGGIGSILIIIVIYVVLKMMGIDPLQLLDESGGSTGGSGYSQSSGGGAGVQDETRDFVSVVMAQTEDVWNGVFKASGGTYQEPRIVLFPGQVETACGFASAATGPFYCPGDKQVYLDTTFFRELQTKFDASGDFAQAYVIAHEVGHHVQNLIGVLPKFNRMRQSMSEVEANRMSVRVELQADCFAGIWGKFVADKGLIEVGDLEEALNAANQIGDDTLQKRSQGYIVPDSFNHGTSEQRMKWFKRGFDSGDMDDCDTFSGSI